MEAYIGEIRAFSFGRVPENWLRCEGQEVPRAQYQALYSIIQDTYGPASERHLFKLPDLRCAVLVGTGVTPEDTYKLGSRGGMAEVTLYAENMPEHTHSLNQAITDKDQTQSIGSPLSTSLISNLPELGAAGTINVANNTLKISPNAKLAETTVSMVGGYANHENRQPYLAINYCICIEGDYPVKAANYY